MTAYAAGTEISAERSKAEIEKTLEREFMADIVLPDGRTTAEWLAPQLSLAYETAQMPALLPGARA